MRRRWIGTILSSAFVAASVVGCAIEPGNPATPFARAPASASDAAPSTSNGVIDTLIGGALGADGGSLIGVEPAKSDPKYRDQAVLAAHLADAHPATAADVKGTDSADLNHDGYVTMDEILAIRDAGVTEEELIRRIGKTHQLFELTKQQQDYLRDDAITGRVIDAMLAH